MVDRKKTLEGVIKWNRNALRKARGEKDTAAIKRFQANIDHCETELNAGANLLTQEKGL